RARSRPRRRTAGPRHRCRRASRDRTRCPAAGTVSAPSGDESVCREAWSARRPVHVQEQVRSALRCSQASVAWTVVASGSGAGIALATGNLSLLAFAGVGLLDAVASIVL